MDAERCAEAKARLAEATRNLENNGNDLAAATAALSVAVSARAALSLGQSDVDSLQGQLQEAKDALNIVHIRENAAELETRVQHISGRLAQAQKEATDRSELDSKITELEAKIRDANHQMEVATSRANAAQADIVLYC